MELTNKTLALLLVVTLVLSMSGTLLSLSRMESFSRSFAPVSARAGSDTGNVTLIINRTSSLIFRIRDINFGSGYVNTSAGANNCTLSSTGIMTNISCVGFTQVYQGLVLENDGSTNLSVELDSNVDNVSLLGGSLGGGPQFQWNITNNETDSCSFGLLVNNGTWMPVNTTGTGTLLCRDLSWTDAIDTLLIHVFVNIPSNSLAGQRNATFTATGTQA